MFIVAILLCCNTLAFKLNKFNTSRLKKQIFAQSFSISTKSPRVLVPVADGSEEIETTTIIDTLVRGGAIVTVASVSNNLIVTCSRGVKLCADKHIIHCTNEDWDLIACPGGMPGAAHLRDSPELKELLMNQNNSGKYIAAICAAPAIVFSSHGLLKGKTATCYPGPKLIAMMENRSNDRVVVDGNVITSQGPGTSLEFSLKLVEILFGVGKATELSKEMLLLV